MGGVINVAIRLKDGRSFCQERWTNTMPFYMQDPKMFLGDEEHVMRYVDLVAPNDFANGAPGLPMPVRNSEYGLIVWDYQSGTIIDNNHYSSPVHIDAIYTGGERRKDNFVTLANAGLLIRRTHDFSNYQRGQSAGDIPHRDTPLLSPEDALQMGEEAYQAERNSMRYDTEADRVEFIVQSPMTYRWMGDHADVAREDEDGETPLSAEYLALLREINFPMTAADGLNSTLSYLDRLPAGTWP